MAVGAGAELGLTKRRGLKPVEKHAMESSPNKEGRAYHRRLHFENYLRRQRPRVLGRHDKREWLPQVRLKLRMIVNKV